MPRKLTGIQRRGDKLRAFVRVHPGPGGLKSQTFSRDTPIPRIEAWRTATKGRYGRAAPGVGGLAELCARYLAMITAKPTKAQIAAHLEAWCAALGHDRDPASLTEHELNGVMDRWLCTPTNQPDPTIPGRRGRPSRPEGLAPGTVLKRRATFRRLFNVMHTTKGFNPVRGTICPDVPAAADVRGIPVADALAVIAAIPEWTWRRKGVRTPTLAKVRARVFLWTGLPPHLIMQIKATDLALDAAIPIVRTARRKKGKGVEARVIELCPQAVAAFRLFVAAHAFGHFEAGPFNVSVKRAGRRAGVPLPADFHAYDLRHTFGAALAESGADEATIARLMMHAEGSTVGRRYIQAAKRLVNVRAVAALGAYGAAAVAGPPAVQKVTRKVTSRRKSVRNKQLQRVS